MLGYKIIIIKHYALHLSGREINYFKKQGCSYLIMNGYGMTEVSILSTVSFQNAHELGSAGIPLVKNVISAFDTETRQELRYGEKGEICIQTLSMVLGYVNNPVETDNIIRKY